MKKKKTRNNKSPYIVGKFDNSETRVECGTDILNPYTEGRHVVILKDFFDSTNNLSVNDNIFEVEAIADMLEYTSPVRVSLFAGYFPYVRSHSYDKYKKRGLIQTRKLEKLVTHLADSGVNEIVTIDPHSNMIWDLCRRNNIEFQDLNPFQSSTSVDYETLGLTKPFDELEKGIIHAQTPFVAFYQDDRSREVLGSLPVLKNPFVIIPDAGAYERSRTFAIESGIGWDNVLWLDKDRIGPGNVDDASVLEQSPLKLGDVKGKEGIIIDDLFATGGTAEYIAKFVKENGGASRIEAWVTHTDNPFPKRYNQLNYIDSIIALETNNQQVSEAHIDRYPTLFYISGMTSLLSAALKRSNYLLSLREGIKNDNYKSQANTRT